MPVYGLVARNEVISAVTVLCTCREMPHLPESKELSVTVIIQLAGSVVPVCQTLAERVEPTILNRIRSQKLIVEVNIACV